MQCRAWYFVAAVTILVHSMCGRASAAEAIPTIPGVATYSVDDAVREVKRTKRPVFAVSYSDTCPVCQGLLKTLASEASLHPVAAQFVNVRINVESPEFRSWESRYPRPSSAIPGVYVIDSSGKAIDLRAGGQSVEDLQTMLTDGLKQSGRLPNDEQLQALSKAVEAARPLVAAGDFRGAILVLKPVQAELAQLYDALILSEEGRTIRQVIDPIAAHGKRQLDEALASKSDAWRTAWTIACVAGDFESFPALAADIDAAQTEFSKDAAQKVMLRQAGELYRARESYSADRSQRGRKALERMVTKYRGKPAGRLAADFLAGREMELPNPAAGDYRTWSDRSGKFSIKAKLRSVAGGKVSLERHDGKVIEVPLDKLSEADRQFIEAESPAI